MGTNVLHGHTKPIPTSNLSDSSWKSPVLARASSYCQITRPWDPLGQTTLWRTKLWLGFERAPATGVGHSHPGVPHLLLVQSSSWWERKTRRKRKRKVGAGARFFPQSASHRWSWQRAAQVKWDFFVQGRAAKKNQKNNHDEDQPHLLLSH